MPTSAGLPVIVVGGGIAGVACARRLHDAGQPVRLVERDARLGGRMASYTEQLDGRPYEVDIGAPYFTVTSSAFAELVAGWQAAGLIRPWTDTFSLAKPDGNGLIGTTTGPMRWASTHGLSRLVEMLAEGLDVRLETPVLQIDYADTPLTVNGEPAAAVVLAMPDQDAAYLVPPELAEEFKAPWSQAITFWAAWEKRWWPADFDGIFVSDSPALTWVSNVGRSRGDDAPVLVAHIGEPAAARDFLDGSTPSLVALSELDELLGRYPSALKWCRYRRWPQASARQTHPEPFLLTDRLVGVCGDAWGPRSRVEQAWSSGNGLAEMLLERLAVP